MAIEMGKQYRTRDGREARIYAVDGGGLYPVHGAFVGDGWEQENWMADGLWAAEKNEDGIPDALDLIEIPPEPTYRPFTPDELPRIVGRRVRYKAITGRIREIIAIDGMYVVMPISGSCETDDFLEHWQFLDYDSDGNEVVTPCGVMVEP